MRKDYVHDFFSQNEITNQILKKKKSDEKSHSI